MFDSSWVHLGGLDVRADQHDQNVDFKYLPPNLSMSNLGHRRTQEISSLWNFPNSQLYQKLNVRECWRINYLIFIGQFSVLGVPRLYTAYFCCLFCDFYSKCTYFLANKSTTFDNFGISRCHTLTLFALPRI